MTARCLALGLSVLPATATHGQDVKDDAVTKPAAEKSTAEKPEAAEKAAKPAAKKADKKADKEAEKKAEKPKPAVDEPKTTSFD